MTEVILAIPLQVLKDIWHAKYGDRWVAQEEIEDSNEWLPVFKRIRELATPMDTVFLQDIRRNVYRLPPE
jgi:hypothetical protein